MDICLIDNSRGIGRIDSNTLFLWFRWETGEELRKRGIENLRLDKVLTKEDRKLIELESIQFAENWYKFDGNDFSMFKDVSLGSLYEWELYWQLDVLLTFALCIKRAVSKYSPKKIYHHFIENSDLYRILVTVAKQHSIELAHSGGENSPIGELLVTDIGTYAKQRKKWISSILHFAVNMTGCIFRKNKYRSSILFHPGNPQLTPILRQWLKAKSSHGAVIDLHSRPPSSLMAQFVKKGGSFIRKSFCFKPNLNHIHSRWTKLKGFADYNEFLSLEKMTLMPILSPLLERIVFTRFADEAATYINYLTAFRVNKISCVVLPNDCVARQKIATLTAKKFNIPSIVVQHGLASQIHDKDKTLADYSLVWSEKTKDICARHGISPDKLFATGSPSLDAYLDYVGQTQNSRGVEKVTVLTTNSPFLHTSSPTYGEDLILNIMKTLQEYKQFKKVNVKIHPSESVEYYQKIIGRFDCVIEKNRPLLDILAESDLVIGGLTSVLIDARILRKPVIVMLEEVYYNVSDMWPPFDRESGLVIATNAQELKQAIDDFLRNRDQFVKDYIEFDDYIGKIDGQSSTRAYQMISKLATPKSGTSV